jgi:hypothetical protein
MKKKFLLMALLGILAGTFNSCSKEDDPCSGVSCLNGGTCNDGTCLCPQFFSGANCGTEVRTQYYGTYVGEMNYDGSIFTVSINLSKSGSNVTRIKWDTDQYLVLTSNNTFSIPSQEYGSSSTTAKGSGSFAGKKVNMSFTVTDDTGGIANVTYSGSKI